MSPVNPLGSFRENQGSSRVQHDLKSMCHFQGKSSRVSEGGNEVANCLIILMRAHCPSVWQICNQAIDLALLMLANHAEVELEL